MEIAKPHRGRARRGGHAINGLASQLLSDNRQTMFQIAQARQLPAIYESPEMAEEGGLLGYGPRLAEIYRKQLSQQTIKLLMGAHPVDCRWKSLRRSNWS